MTKTELLSLIKEEINKRILEDTSTIYKDWEQFENPSKIKVYLTNGKVLEIGPSKLKGGKKTYDIVLQAFIDDRFDITDKLIKTMIYQKHFPFLVREKGTTVKESHSAEAIRPDAKLYNKYSTDPKYHTIFYLIDLSFSSNSALSEKAYSELIKRKIYNSQCDLISTDPIIKKYFAEHKSNWG